jgi:hypothetical protein
MSTTGDNNNHHPVVVSCEHCQQSFASRNQLFKHLRDSPSCVPNAELLSAAPSVQKRQEKKRKHAEFRSRTKRPTSGATSGGSSTTTTTILSLNAQRQKSQDCCLWFGDLPLSWTRHGGKFKRFRALLRHLLPDNIPDPWIQHVQRKAYRIKKQDSSNNDDNDQAGQPQKPHDDGDDDGDDEGDSDDDNGNHDAATTTRHNSNSTSSNYVGYAIIAFRDVAECRTVATLLDGVEIKVEDVFNERDVGSSSDFSSFRQSKPPPFILRVKSHQPRNNSKKNGPPSAAASATSSSSTGGDEPDAAASLPLSDAQEETNEESPTTVLPTAGIIRLDIDPPLVDLFRPLTTAELCQRIVKKRSGTVTPPAVAFDPATISHEEALQLAVDTYERVGIARPIVRSQGREIPTSIRDPLLHILKHLRWAIPNHRQNISVERYLVLLTKVVTEKKDAVYGDLRNACQTLMDWADPNYYYSGIAVTKNFCGSPHIDHRDRNFQYAVSFLDDNSDDDTATTTDGGELCVDGTDENGQEVIHVVTTTNRIAAIDGRNVHWVRPWTAGMDRYSLIFYDTSCEEERPRLPRGVM